MFSPPPDEIPSYPTSRPTVVVRHVVLLQAIMKTYVDAACQLSNTVSTKRATLARNLADPERALAEIMPKKTEKATENATTEQQ